MKKFHYFALFFAFLGVFSSGFYCSRHLSARNEASTGRRILYYLDPMNPSHTSDKPGLAPCGMKLEPVYADDDADGQASGNDSMCMPPGTVKISSHKQQLIGVQVGRAEWTSESHTLRTLGRVAADENRIYRILAPTEGYLDDFPHAVQTGSMVQKDQLLASYFSTESLAAQQAYLLALRTVDRMQRDPAFEEQTGLRGESVDIQVRQAEENLKLFGIGETQMREIARSRQIIRVVEQRAPTAGLLVSRNINPYSRFEKNTEFFRIADLSRVWIFADIFENEEIYIKAGTVARITLPGRDQVFQAKVSDTVPQFDSNSRTYKVRLDVDNPEMSLRPDAFVDVEFSLQFEQTITVPADAVLDSGLKKTVFVDHANGFFEPRQVKTGWSFGNRVEILQGLMPGERIVTSGNFLIDSESRMKLAAAGLHGTTSVDPVCGMDVDEQKAEAMGAKTQSADKTYFFCSTSCKQKFDENPDRFLGRKEEGAPHGERHPSSTSPVESLEHKTNEHPEGNLQQVDPVCGMLVARESAEASGHTSQIDGRTLFFCNSRCKQKFDNSPGHFLHKEKEAVSRQADTGPSVSSMPDSELRTPAASEEKGMQVDPVCGMKIDPVEAQAAGHKRELDGMPHFFCSEECMKDFDKNPDPYAGKSVLEQPSHDSSSMLNAAPPDRGDAHQ